MLFLYALHEKFSFQGIDSHYFMLISQNLIDFHENTVISCMKENLINSIHNK